MSLGIKYIVKTYIILYFSLIIFVNLLSTYLILFIKNIEKDCTRIQSYSKINIISVYISNAMLQMVNKIIEKKVGIGIGIEEKMGEKKVLGCVMFVMAYGFTVTTLSYSQAPATCNGDEKLLSLCGEYLVNNKPNPSSDCCNAASDAFKRAMAIPHGQGIRDICNCLRVEGPNLNFHQDRLVSLPDVCHIKLSFSMQLCVFGS